MFMPRPCGSCMVALSRTRTNRSLQNTWPCASRFSQGPLRSLLSGRPGFAKRVVSRPTGRDPRLDWLDFPMTTLPVSSDFVNDFHFDFDQTLCPPAPALRMPVGGQAISTNGRAGATNSPGSHRDPGSVRRRSRQINIDRRWQCSGRRYRHRVCSGSHLY